MDNIIAGAAFGASLVASGMYQPYLIASQFSFQKWNMVQTFLTATGCSALSIELLRRLGRPVPSPRPWSSTGITGSPIDGNVIGGLLLGAGMSLSASCPGMLFAQLALGIPSAPATLAGAVAGGICWAAVVRPWIASRRKELSNTKAQWPPPPPKTLEEALGAKHTVTFLAFEAALAAAVALAVSRGGTAPSPVHPVAGGLAIGAAQTVSLLARGSLLGVSACYEQVGDWVVYLSKGGLGSGDARPGTSAVVFSAGLAVGAWLLAHLSPSFLFATASTSSPLAFVGGFLMAVGSRMAGGCPSGHGISGMAQMSSSSFLTMAATFAAAGIISKVAA